MSIYSLPIILRREAEKGGKSISIGDVIGLISLTIILPGIIFHLFFMPTLREPESENYQALRNRLAGHSQREEVYRASLTRFLRWLDRFFEGPEVIPYLPDRENLSWRERIRQRVFFRKYADVPQPEPRGKSWQPNPWSVAAYDRCLLIAVLYPFIAAIIGWVLFGTGGELAKVIGFADVSDGLYRAVFFVLLTAAGTGCVKFLRGENRWHDSVALVVGFGTAVMGPVILNYLFPQIQISAAVALAVAFSFVVAFASADAFAGAGAFAFAVAFAITVAGVGAFAGAGAGAGAVAGAFAFAVAFVGAFAFAGAFAGAGAGAVAVAVAFAFAGAGAGAKKLSRLGLFLAVLSIMQIAAMGFLLYYAGGQTESVRSFSLLVAFVILPLVNAPFDWASTGLTRFLLRKNVSETQPVKRALWSCLDFSGALFLLVLLCVAMVIALEMTSGIAQSGGFSGTLVDVQALLTDIRDHPGENRHYWLYFAVLSTLIPTFLHLAIWVASTATFQSERLSTWAVPLLDSNFAKGSADRNKLGMALTAQVMAAGAVSLTLLFAILWLLASLFGLGAYLIDMLLWLSGVCQGWFA